AITDVICVVGVIDNFGAAPILVLWAIDAAIVMGFAGLIAGVVDRVNRARALMVLLCSASLLHIGVAGLFLAEVRPALCYGALLALGRIDANLVVTFAWSLARDHFDFESGVKGFSRLNAVAGVAGSIGTLIATALISPLARAAGVLGIAMLFAIAGAVVWRRAPRVPTRSAADVERERISLPPRADAAASFSIPPPLSVRSLAPPPISRNMKPVTHAEAIRFVFGSRAFRAVAWLGVINGSAHSVLAYEVLRVLERSGGSLTTQYGVLRFVEPIVLALVPAFLAPVVIRRVGIRGAFVVTSVAVVVGVGTLASLPLPATAIACGVLSDLAFGLDYAGFTASLTEIPERLRPRTSVLLDGTVYHVGYLSGVVLLVVAAFAAKLVARNELDSHIALVTTFVLNLVGLRLALRFNPQFGSVRESGLSFERR
ncbi:MAG TPA: hypothetical protein VM925_09115, partial [Labilithrix sp.]|nr:hypothetical protein [Labilithrix sp.]